MASSCFASFPFQLEFVSVFLRFRVATNDGRRIQTKREERKKDERNLRRAILAWVQDFVDGDLFRSNANLLP
jgi:hypothetical protein